ncbi:MAG: DUF4123 domain-containing protein [Phycisphaerales bacterium]|nr:MAG: DUF4123 domain-containing protein [Phycisphaerales bacterium]
MTEPVKERAPGTSGAALHAFVERYRRADERLFGVVDTARDKDLAFDGAVRFGWAIEWLFGEGAAAHLKDVAPYLVSMAYQSRYPYPESEYLDLWAERLGRAAGILLVTAAGADAVWNHFRSVFVLEDERGRKGYLRFYDPRVLPKLLSEYSREGAERFFGPVRLILMEADTPGSLLVCYLEGGRVVMDEVPIVSPEGVSNDRDNGSVREL